MTRATMIMPKRDTRKQQQMVRTMPPPKEKQQQQEEIRHLEAEENLVVDYPKGNVVG